MVSAMGGLSIHSTPTGRSRYAADERRKGLLFPDFVRLGHTSKKEKSL